MQINRKAEKRRKRQRFEHIQKINPKKLKINLSLMLSYVHFSEVMVEVLHDASIYY
jgi:hypothetical protein